MATRGKKEAEQAPSKSQLKKQFKPRHANQKPMTYQRAIDILRGAGIPLDEKKKEQVWFWGHSHSPKVIAAGTFLDSYQLEEKSVWRTVWYNDMEHYKAIMSLRKGKDERKNTEETI